MSIVGTRNRIFFHCRPLPIEALFLATLIKFLTSSGKSLCPCRLAANSPESHNNSRKPRTQSPTPAPHLLPRSYNVNVIQSNSQRIKGACLIFLLLQSSPSHCPSSPYKDPSLKVALLQKHLSFCRNTLPWSLLPTGAQPQGS